MTTVNRSWSDEDMELIREAFRAKVIRLGKLLRDSGAQLNTPLYRALYFDLANASPQI